MRPVTIQNASLEDWEHQAIQELMEQMQDPQQALEDVRIEDEANCDIGAGIADYQLGRFLSDPAGFCQHQRLRTLVIRELRQILTECDLGVGLKAAHKVGKELLIERLMSPPPEIQAQLRAILAEDLSSAEDIPLSSTAAEQLRQVIQTVLLADDWEVISAAAALSLQQHVRAVVMLPQTA